MATGSFISEAVGRDHGIQIPHERLFGMNVCTFDMQETIAYLDDVLQSGGNKVVFTANVDHVVRLDRDLDFRRCYEAADLVFADGMPLMWASRLLRRDLRARITGIDLLSALCELANLKGYRCFFLGGREETIDRACAALRQRFRSLQITGTHHGYFEDSEVVLDSVRRAQPHLLFVGMGSPRQEHWVAEHRGRLSGVILPVGGSFEVIAGEKLRAPQWVQRAGMEWMWRLAQDPRRLWKRYLWEDLLFVKLFFRELRT